MYCDDCGKRISQEEFLENDMLCMVCFDELIDEVMDDDEDDLSNPDDNNVNIFSMVFS